MGQYSNCSGACQARCYSPWDITNSSSGQHFFAGASIVWRGNSGYYDFSQYVDYTKKSITLYSLYNNGFDWNTIKSKFTTKPKTQEDDFENAAGTYTTPGSSTVSLWKKYEYLTYSGCSDAPGEYTRYYTYNCGVFQGKKRHKVWSDPFDVRIVSGSGVGQYNLDTRQWENYDRWYYRAVPQSYKIINANRLVDVWKLFLPSTALSNSDIETFWQMVLMNYSNLKSLLEGFSSKLNNKKAEYVNLRNSINGVSVENLQTKSTDELSGIISTLKSYKTSYDTLFGTPTKIQNFLTLEGLNSLSLGILLNNLYGNTENPSSPNYPLNFNSESIANVRNRNFVSGSTTLLSSSGISNFKEVKEPSAELTKRSVYLHFVPKTLNERFVAKSGDGKYHTQMKIGTEYKTLDSLTSDGKFTYISALKPELIDGKPDYGTKEVFNPTWSSAFTKEDKDDSELHIESYTLRGFSFKLSGKTFKENDKLFKIYESDAADSPTYEYKVSDEFASWTTIIDRATIPTTEEVNKYNLFCLNFIYPYSKYIGDVKNPSDSELSTRCGSLIYEACIDWPGYEWNPQGTQRVLVDANETLKGTKIRKTNEIPSLEDYNTYYLTHGMYLQDLAERKTVTSNDYSYPGNNFTFKYYTNWETRTDSSGEIMPFTAPTDVWNDLSQDAFTYIKNNESLYGNLNDNARKTVKDSITIFLTFYNESFTKVGSNIGNITDGQGNPISIGHEDYERFTVLNGTSPISYKGEVTDFDNDTLDEFVDISLLDNGIKRQVRKPGRSNIYLLSDNQVVIWSSDFIEKIKSEALSTEVDRRFLLIYNLASKKLDKILLDLADQLDPKTNDLVLMNVISYGGQDLSYWKHVNGDKITYTVDSISDDFYSGQPIYSYEVRKENDENYNFYLDAFTQEEIELFDFDTMNVSLRPFTLDPDHYYTDRRILNWVKNTGSEEEEGTGAVITIDDQLPFEEGMTSSNTLDCWIMVSNEDKDNFNYGYGRDIAGIGKVPEFLTLFRVGESNNADFASYINQHEEGKSIFDRYPNPWINNNKLIKENFFENNTQNGFKVKPLTNKWGRNILRVIPFDSRMEIEGETYTGLYWKNLIVHKDLQDNLFEGNIKSKDVNVFINDIEGTTGFSEYLEIVPPSGVSTPIQEGDIATVKLLGIEVEDQFYIDDSAFGDEGVYKTLLENSNNPEDVKLRELLKSENQLYNRFLLNAEGKTYEELANESSIIPMFKSGQSAKSNLRNNPCAIYETSLESVEKIEGEYYATFRVSDIDSELLTIEDIFENQNDYKKTNELTNPLIEKEGTIYARSNEYKFSDYRLEISSIQFRRNGKNKNLKMRPITYSDESINLVPRIVYEDSPTGRITGMQIVTDNDELYIPKFGYGQTASGEYTLPNENPFKEDLFYTKGFIKNKNGNRFKLVDENGNVGDENSSTGLMLDKTTGEQFQFTDLMFTEKSFETADKKLDLWLEPKEVNLRNYLIDLRNIEVENTGDSINIIFERTSRCNPEWFEKLESWQSKKDRHDCKLVIGSNKLDKKNPNVIEISQTELADKVANGGLYNTFEKNQYIINNLEEISPTRQYSGLIPNGTKYRDATNKAAEIKNANIKDNRYRSVDQFGNFYYIDQSGNLTTNPAQSRDFSDLYGIKSVGLYDDFPDLLRCCKVSNTGAKTGLYGDYLTSNYLIKLNNERDGIKLIKSSRHTTVYTVNGLENVKGTQDSFITKDGRVPFNLNLQQNIRLSYKQTKFGKSNILVLRDKDGNRVSVSIFDKDVKIKDNLFVVSSI